jgi:colanic acid/amylovoran biosynthesis glycosyltransferase
LSRFTVGFTTADCARPARSLRIFRSNHEPLGIEYLLTSVEKFGMRIAYLVTEYPATSHTFIRREVNALRARGISVATFSVRRPDPVTVSSARDRASLEETWYILPPNLVSLATAHLSALFGHPRRYLRALFISFRHRVPGMRGLVFSLIYFAEAIMLARELERQRIDHLHTHFANSGSIVGLLASRYLELTWSFTLHGISETDYPAGVLLGAKIEAARFVACASYFGRAQAMRVVSPEHWSKIFVVRCAIDLADLPSRGIIGKNVRPRLICVGRLSPEKGYFGLLEAFAKVRTSGVDGDLVIVGDGPERARIEGAIDNLDLRANVSLKGALDEQATLQQIANADILVLPSFMEGLPVVLMEAMALGLPVIASRVAGIPELVTDDQHGLLFCPTDWNELAEKIDQLIADPELRQRLGQAGRSRVELAFEINRAIEPLAIRFSDKALAASIQGEP